MNAQCHACIGGTVVREDMRKLEAGVHIVVGTPGRVYDMINRRALGRWFSGVWGTGVPSESSQQQNKWLHFAALFTTRLQVTQQCCFV